MAIALLAGTRTHRGHGVGCARTAARAARDDADLDRLAARLAAAMRETMRPAHVSLWLKPTADALRNER